MKMTHVHLLAVCLGLSGAACRANLGQQEAEYPFAIPVELTESSVAGDVPIKLALDKGIHPAGDVVVLDEVRGTTDHLVAGGSYIASGHYKLSSLDEAQLYLGLTNGRIEGDCTRFVSRGEGAFRIPFRVVEEGKLHVTFYKVSAENGAVVTTAYYQEPGHAR